MSRYISALMLILMLTGLAAAQDWRKDPASTSGYNCDLVDALAEDFGSENILQTDSGEVTALSEFLFSLFPECPRWDDVPASERLAEDGRLAELIEADELESIRVLVENTTLEWGDPACSIMVDDFNETDFNVLTGGHSLDGIQVDVYLPGTKEPVEMDVVKTDVTRSGLPIRQAWLEGDDFPLGEYLFEVHIDGETSHFIWLRNDNAMNTISLVCPDRPIASGAESAPATTAGADREVTAVLNDNDSYGIEDPVCTVFVADQYEADLNVLLIDWATDNVSVDVYLPGESDAIAMANRQADEFEAYGKMVPILTLWAERDSFPLGTYSFDVHGLGESYRFEWIREDSAVNTIVVICDEPEPAEDTDTEADDEEPAVESDTEADDDEPAVEPNTEADDDTTALEPDTEAGDDLTARLTDGEFLDLEEIGCFITTSNLESPFLGFAVAGYDLEDTSLSITFPGETSPKSMDHQETLTGEDSFPYRVEWVEVDELPAGIYTIDVSTPDGEFRFEWDRQDDAYRTIFFSCVPTVEDE